MEQDEKMVEVAHSYNVNHSTIGTKEQGQDHGTCEVHCTNDVDSNIKEVWIGDGGDGGILSVWMQHQPQGEVPLSLMLMQEKAKSLYEDLKKKHSKESEGSSFNASHLVFHGGSDGKESACSVGDLGSIPGLGRSPGEGVSSPLQYSGLENFMGRGAWWATVHGFAKSQT